MLARLSSCRVEFVWNITSNSGTQRVDIRQLERLSDFSPVFSSRALLGWQKDLTPLDQALNTVMAALLAAEFLAGIAAINRVMRSQVEKYYLVDFTREALLGSSKAHSG